MFTSGGKKMRLIKFLVLLVLIICFLQVSLFSRISSRVEGTVIDKDTGQPIEGAKIYLYKIIDDYSGITHEYETTTGKKGKFRFDDVEKGSYFLRCVKNYYISVLPNFYYGPWAGSESLRPASPLYLYKDRDELKKNINIFRLDEGKIKYFKIAMERGGKIQGKVLVKFDNGTFGMSCFISLYRKREVGELFFLKDELKIAFVTSDRNGFFEIKDLVPYNKYYLKIISMSSTKTKRIDDIEIKSSETTEIVYTIDWTNTTGIKGKVRIDDRAAKLASVSILTPDNKHLRTTYTGEDGDFLLCELEPGKYIIEFTSSEFDSVTDNFKYYNKKISVSLKEDEIKRIDVSLRSQ